MRKLVALLSLLVLPACGGAATPDAPPGAPVAPKPAGDDMMAAMLAGDPAPAAPPAAPPPPPAPVTVAMLAKSGSKLAGKATLTDVPGGVQITLELEGVKPGDHGAHVHEKGDCSDPEGKNAGGHFNPGGHDHALPGKADHRHLGDLGNVTIGKDGKGTLTITIPGANLLVGDAKSFLGRSIIVHEKADDGGQPVGNAGGRIGCGVIGAK